MDEVVETQTAISQRTFSVCRGDRVDIISIDIDAVAVSSSYYIMVMPNLGHCEVFFCFSSIFMFKLLTHGHQGTTAEGENKTKLIFSLNRGSECEHTYYVIIRTLSAASAVSTNLILVICIVFFRRARSIL